MVQFCIALMLPFAPIYACSILMVGINNVILSSFGSCVDRDLFIYIKLDFGAGQDVKFLATGMLRCKGMLKQEVLIKLSGRLICHGHTLNLSKV